MKFHSETHILGEINIFNLRQTIKLIRSGSQKLPLCALCNVYVNSLRCLLNKFFYLFRCKQAKPLTCTWCVVDVAQQTETRLQVHDIDVPGDGREYEELSDI